MEIYNSLIRKIEKFMPIEKNKVVMYVCGLTPYDDVHLGHARTYILFDILKRYLIKKKLKVFHIQNITDVEDKIINRAKESNRNPLEIADEFQGKADVLFERLNILKADIYPKASEHIKEIIELIKKIIKNGFAYESKDGVYFEVSKFKNYGKLSGQNVEELKKGARIEVNENKRNPEDFTLWKKEEDELIEFESEFGKGRPGWHIECSAMSMKYSKGKTLDIHGGGRDLSFPHHENEIAQTEAGFGIPFVNYWMHTGFLTVNGEKMSKSLGNFVTLKDVLDKHDPNSVRLFFAQTHYRSPIDYSEKEIEASHNTVERIFEVYNKLGDKGKEKGEGKKFFEKEIKEFYEHMDNDLDTPQAFASFFNLIKKVNVSLEGKGINKEGLKYLLKEFENILWILGLKEEKKEIDLEGLEKLRGKYKVRGRNANNIIEELIELRNKFRKEKKYKEADEIRDELKKIGIILEDKEGKTKYKVT